MWIILVLLLAALVASYLMGRNNPGGARMLQAAVAAVALVVALVFLFTRRGPATPTYDTRFEEAAAFRLGQAVAADFPEGGRVAVVRMLFKAPGGVAERIAAAQDAALRRGLGGAGFALTPAGPQLVEDGMEFADHSMAMEYGQWGAVMVEWLAPHRDCVAVVSFAGVPADLPAGAGVPPVYALANDPLSRGDWVRPLQAGLARLVLATRPEAATRLDAPRGSLDSVAAFRYEAYTPETAATYQPAVPGAERSDEY